jgi:hypothetical protein
MSLLQIFRNQDEIVIPSGRAKRDPESRIFKLFWIPAFAGMTE